MIVTTGMLRDQWKDYGDPAGKISRMKQQGKLFQLDRGIYETDPNTPGYCLTGAIYGPTYCDKLYTMPPVMSQREIRQMLFEDLRIDHDLFDGLDADGLLKIGGLYHCNNLKCLMKFLKRERARINSVRRQGARSDLQSLEESGQGT